MIGLYILMGGIVLMALFFLLLKELSDREQRHKPSRRP